MNYVDFFSYLGFDFKNDLKPNSIKIEKNSYLSEKLQDSVFYYKNPNNTNTSFYLISIDLNDSEIEELRKYVWNRNDADLIFIYDNPKNRLNLFYGKYSPKISNKDSFWESFSTSKEDLEKIEKIQHWQFDSGVFWLNYHRFIDASKYKGIDKELVATLEMLKKQLDKTLLKLLPNEDNRNEVVQALIDRTLYIKYLEDNHIINSHFYRHYFKDSSLNYKTLLERNSNNEINRLFGIIHEIFNNSLFDQPTINNEFLNLQVCNLIANSFNTDLKSGQLRLYDFQFDVLPVEFISYIYEVFLSDKQKENGIYYTPKKLAQLIIDEVINEDEIGSILDPSSGSGMFLIVGYQRLLEIARKKKFEPEDSLEKIRFRTRLLSENIFGIEKELTAQRFTLFSLSLQIFKEIDPEVIKNFIATELQQNKKINLFSEFSFFENIKRANSLDIIDKPFFDRKFSYIVGNPPFFEIPNTEDYKNEISFLKSFKVALKDEEDKTAKDIVGKSQISQCFFLKIKDWANDNTRFGFVSNSSNFYNDYSEKFQNYFYSYYGIEKIYELSRVKKILFEKAKESVVALIFTNKYKNNTTDYYPVELGLFSEKPFELLIIQEDKVIPIEQEGLMNKEIRLRDFLVGNSYDFKLINQLNEINQLATYIYNDNDDYFIHRGIEVVGYEEIEKEFQISKEDWKPLSKKQREEYYEQFKSKYSSKVKTKDFNIPFLKPVNIEKFRINSISSYLGEDISMLHRPRKKELYKGKRVLWSRIGLNLKAVFVKTHLYFDFDLYVLKLKDESLYNFVVALMNSKLLNYYINIHLKKRVDSSYPKIGIEDVKKLPIPNNLDVELLNQISYLSDKLTEGVYDYTDIENDLNELIYELYELSYWEKQRIEDYFLPKERIGRKRTALSKYISTLKELLGFYFKKPIIIEEKSADFNLKVIKVLINQSSDTPNADKVQKYIINEIFEQNPNENFLASQEKIFGKNCVFIIKEDINKNWTETKAFEDAQDLLKRLISNKNGERIH